MGLGILVSRPSSPSSGRLSNGSWMVAASGEGVVVSPSAQLGSFSLSWASETMTYTQKIHMFVSSLFWGTFKKKIQHCFFSTTLQYYFNKSSWNDVPPLCHVSQST